MTTSDSDMATHQRQRIERLTRVVEGADAERELAIFRAHQAGVPVAELARAALLDETEIDTMIDRCRRDPNMDGFSDGPEWVQMYPNHGWHIFA